MYTIITRDNCEYCDKVKALLELDSLPYTVYNLSDVPNKWVLRLLREANIKTVPQVFDYSGSWIGGFTELHELLTEGPL